MTRIDKYLADLGMTSRRGAKEYLHRNMILVDGERVIKAETKVDEQKSVVQFNGKELTYSKFTYLLMNKPAGVVSAKTDKKDKTVIDLLEGRYKKMDLFPVGRLDKDTVGLLLLTNDGQFAHEMLAPKKHVPKRYYAELDQAIDSADIEAFRVGITIDGDCLCKPALLEALENGKQVHVEISEGKFHQVKKMFAALGKYVLYLKRVKFGNIALDENLAQGEYRELSTEEKNALFHNR